MKVRYLITLALVTSTCRVDAQTSSLLLAFGQPTISNPTSSPFHQTAWTANNKTWNTVANSNVSSGLLYGNGSAATGVTVSLGAGATYIVNFGTLPSNSGSPGVGAFTQPPYQSVFSSGAPATNAIWEGSSPASSTSVGVSVGGLAPGTYNVFVVGANTGNNASPTNPNGVEAENFYYSTSTGVPTGNVNTGKLKTLYPATLILASTFPWQAGNEYVEMPGIAIIAGQNINIYGTGAGSGTNGESRAFVNSIEIVPVTPTLPPFYGINTNEAMDSESTYFTNATLITTGSQPGIINQTGLNAIRDCPLWSACETTQGTIVVPPAFVTYINSAAASGISPVILLAYGNNFYNGGGYPSDTPADIQAFTNYCVAVVTKFKGTVHYYQVWNEWENGTGMSGKAKTTTAAYVSLLQSVYTAIKQVDPTITVLGSSIVTDPTNKVLNDALAAGELTCCDALDFHYETYNVATDPYASLEDWSIQMATEPTIIQAANKGDPFPIYNTEMSWPSLIGTGGVTQEEQAQFVARYYLMGSTMPYISGLFWDDLKDEDESSSDASGNKGIFRNDFTPKLAFSAVKDLMGYLQGASYISRIPAGLNTTYNDPNVFYLKFEQANGNYFVAAWSEWADDDWNMYLQVPAGTTNLNVTTEALGHGGEATAFTMSASNTAVPALSTTIRRNPLIIQGPCIQNASCWMYQKIAFPEAIRTTVQETTNIPPDGAGSNGGP
jgi:hypothetical protein